MEVPPQRLVIQPWAAVEEHKDLATPNLVKVDQVAAVGQLQAADLVETPVYNSALMDTDKVILERLDLKPRLECSRAVVVVVQVPQVFLPAVLVEQGLSITSLEPM
jgi:hypothetical protein